MNNSLSIAVSYPAPKRESRYPRTWFLYGQERGTVKVHVAHEGNAKPHIVDKSAA